MAIGFVAAGLVIGTIGGLAFAIWIVSVAGYDWSEVMHRWRIAMVYRRYKEEIEIEIIETRELNGPPT